MIIKSFLKFICIFLCFSQLLFAQYFSLDKSAAIDSIIINGNTKYTCSYNSSGTIEQLLHDGSIVKEYFYNDKDLYGHLDSIIINGKKIVIFDYEDYGWLPTYEITKVWDGTQWNKSSRKTLEYYDYYNDYFLSYCKNENWVNGQWVFSYNKQYFYDTSNNGSKPLVKITKYENGINEDSYYQYDCENRLTSIITNSFRGNGGALYYSHLTKYSYSSENNLIRIDYDDDGGAGLEGLIEFYDGFGNYFQFNAIYLEIYYGGLTPNNVNDEKISSAFTVSQNYPNPFNPLTTIEYKVNKTSRVSIIVFNMDGQKIKQLVNEEKSMGNYSVSWNGQNSSGRKVASGSYFYQIKIGDVLQTKKMIFLK